METQPIIDQLKNLDTKIVAALIAAIVSLIVAFLNFLNQRKALKLQEQQLLSINIDNKRKPLEKQLNEFYIPFDQYLSFTTELYKNLRNGLPKEFRLLVYLIDNETLFDDGNGNKVKAILGKEKLIILDKIIKKQEDMYRLILEKSCFITDKVLVKDYHPNTSITDVKILTDPNSPNSIPNEVGLLTLFSVHIEYMKMARNGELKKDDLEIVKNYVFPRELNNRIKENIIKIQEEIKNLN